MNEQLHTLEKALRKLTRRLAEIESTGKMTGEEGVRTQRALHELLLENEQQLRKASEIFNSLSESDRLRLCDEHHLNASLIESENAVAATLSVLDDAHRKTWGTDLEPLYYFDTYAVVMLPRYVSFAKYAA